MVRMLNFCLFERRRSVKRTQATSNVNQHTHADMESTLPYAVWQRQGNVSNAEAEQDLSISMTTCTSRFVTRLHSSNLYLPRNHVTRMVRMSRNRLVLM